MPVDDQMDTWISALQNVKIPTQIHGCYYLTWPFSAHMQVHLNVAFLLWFSQI